jgi:hypothetical protein
MEKLKEKVRIQRPLPTYYQNLDYNIINESFRDFDDSSNLSHFGQAISSSKSLNFCVDFGDAESWCAFDLDASAFSRLTRTPVRIICPHRAFTKQNNTEAE